VVAQALGPGLVVLKGALDEASQAWLFPLLVCFFTLPF
jgi:hypothetical protein